VSIVVQDKIAVRLHDEPEVTASGFESLASVELFSGVELVHRVLRVARGGCVGRYSVLAERRAVDARLVSGAQDPLKTQPVSRWSERLLNAPHPEASMALQNRCT
jgi:hypothetical protein